MKVWEILGELVSLLLSNCNRLVLIVAAAVPPSASSTQQLPTVPLLARLKSSVNGSDVIPHGSLTVTVKTSSTNNVPPSVARTVIVATPLVLAVKLISRALSAPMVGVTRPGFVLLWIVNVSWEPSSASVNTALRSR